MQTEPNTGLRARGMLHPGNAGPNAIPSPAVPARFEQPSIRVNRFWTKYRDPIAGSPESTEDGTQKFLQEEHWVEWVKIGEQNGSTCVEAVKRLKPAKDGKTRIEWYVIGPAYEAWLEGQDEPDNGQPLYAWGAISRELSDELAKFNVRTVEDLASFPDHRLTAVPIPGLREIRRRAKLTIEARDTTDVGMQLAVRDEQLDEIKRERDAMKASMAAMQSQMDALARNAGIAAETLTRSVSSPDDEYVQPGPNDVPIGKSARQSRRKAADHIDRALGNETGEALMD